MLPDIAVNGAINRFLRCFPVRDRIKLRRLPRSSGPAPVDHVAVVTAVSVQSQLVICEESPPFRV